MASFMKVAAWEGGIDIAPIAGGPEELERSLESCGSSSWVSGVGRGSIYTVEEDGEHGYDDTEWDQD